MERIGRRIETALEESLARTVKGPPRLAAALRHAVFPGGARLRPRLTLLVSRACGEDDAELAAASAAAVELMHCASLVHDDLPCFDDAAVRRGRPSVHRAFGEEIAVLAGDGLIVLAFEALARGGVRSSPRVAPAIAALARGVGPAQGIVAGQAWESEPTVDLRRYHRAKTGALFEAAAALGAIAAGAAPGCWQDFGRAIGEAYQVADDLADATGTAAELGKPASQDSAHDRPSVVAELGVSGARGRFLDLLDDALAHVPPGPAEVEVRAFIDDVARRFRAAEPRRVAAG